MKDLIDRTLASERIATVARVEVRYGSSACRRSALTNVKLGSAARWARSCAEAT